MEEHAEAPLILTLELAPEDQGWAQRQRDLYFPPERNIVPAHITLFHAMNAIDRDDVLTVMKQRRPAPLVRIEAPYLLGRGVAYRIFSPDGAKIREAIRQLIPNERLTKQDQAPWRPHLTVQNKVTPEQARDLHARLSTEPAREESRAAALNLWRYLGGPWERLERVPFTDQ
ncbi:2'-5' RNA ligase family protein [Asaia astilbis]|uniref:2'-5' RNA ligase family protein n=1 Tax=Asaia astilbis TaxID=610244 RepID=UPI00046EEC98|nr:2'-5' RNA ligase family protein [Asaia astilbis]